MTVKVYNTDDDIEIWCDARNKIHISIDGADMFRCKTILAKNILKAENGETHIQLSIVPSEFEATEIHK